MESTVIFQAVVLFSTFCLLYLSYGCIYRLYLSPLAAIPGPKIAALSGMYEMYFDLIEKARFPWKIEYLHERYGLAGTILVRI